MKVAIIGFYCKPSNTILGSRESGGQNLNIYYMLEYYKLNGIDVIYIDCAKNSLINFNTFDNNYSKAINDCVPYLEKGIQKLNLTIVHTCGSLAGEIYRVVRNKNISFKRIVWIHSNFATVAQRLFYVYNKDITDINKLEICQYERIINKEADKIITGSHNESAELINLFKIEKSKLHIVYRGIDKRVFKNKNVNRIDGIICCGRMAPIKDFPFLIDSISIIKGKYPNLLKPNSCLIVGGRADELYYQSFLKYLHNSDVNDIVNVQTAVNQRKLALLLNKYKVFAGVSLHETFGLLPIESCAVGTPCVVRDNSAYREINLFNTGCIISDNISPEIFANNLVNILTLSRVKWLEMSDNALEYSRNFSWEVYAKKNINIYCKSVIENEYSFDCSI